MKDKRLEYMGLLIKNFRLNNGFTQEDLSSLSGLHTNTIRNIEHGKDRGFNFTSILKCLDALDVPLNEFLADIDFDVNHK